MKKLIVFSLVALFAGTVAFADDGVNKSDNCKNILAQIAKAKGGSSGAVGDKDAPPASVDVKKAD